MDPKPSRGFSIYDIWHHILPSLSLCARLSVPGWVFSRLSPQPRKPSRSSPLLSVDTQATAPWSIPELQAKQVSEAVVSLRRLRHREEKSHLLCSICRPRFVLSEVVGLDFGVQGPLTSHLTQHYVWWTGGRGRSFWKKR